MKYVQFAQFISCIRVKLHNILRKAVTPEHVNTIAVDYSYVIRDNERVNYALINSQLIVLSHR